jgi:hypothetical protein
MANLYMTIAVECTYTVQFSLSYLASTNLGLQSQKSYIPSHSGCFDSLHVLVDGLIHIHIHQAAVLSFFGCRSWSQYFS